MSYAPDAHIWNTRLEIVFGPGGIPGREMIREPQSHGSDSLARFPANKTLGLGVIDQAEPAIESPEQVIARVEAALKYVPAERTTLNPVCGLSPSSQNPVDIDAACLKLSVMCSAAEMLRHA